jgi:[ribosomal protein S5]-alanine N-acetyltransferase
MVMISLRDYKTSDAERLVLLADNYNVSRYLVDTFPYPCTQQDADWWIETGSKANNEVTKVIEAQGEFVGSIGLSPQTGWKNHMAEIGYWLGEAYWGRGIAAEALKIMTDYAISNLKYKKLFAPVLEPNKASMRVLEKCGYKLEGILQQEVFKEDRYFNIYHYAFYSSTI